MNKYFPILLIVISNTIYHLCSKGSPANLNPFVSLTVTYGVAAIGSFFLFFATGVASGSNLIQEYSHVNFTSFLIGLAIIGVDVGNRYMYRAGWALNTGFIVQSILCSLGLIVLGFLIYKEGFTSTKAIGTVFCIIGIVFINR